MAGIRKNECTPEEWQAHLAKVRAYRNANTEHARQVRQDYERRPEVKARKAIYDARPHQIERRQRNRKTEHAKAMKELRRKLRWKEILAKQRQRRTGFTPELIAALLAVQKNRCAVCRRPFSADKKICADHCHQTKTPRGLLCHACNIIEGMLTSTELRPRVYLERLIRYLANPPMGSIKRA